MANDLFTEPNWFVCETCVTAMNVAPNAKAGWGARREAAKVRQHDQAGCQARLELIASGEGLALDVIADLVTQIAAAQRGGHQVILVTSGAARLGGLLPELESTLRRYTRARRDGPL